MVEGPFADRHLLAMVRSGALTRMSLVRAEGSETWEDVGSSGLMDRLRNISRLGENYAAPESSSYLEVPSPVLAKRDSPQEQRVRLLRFHDLTSLANLLTALLCINLLLKGAVFWAQSIRLEHYSHFLNDGIRVPRSELISTAQRILWASRIEIAAYLVTAPIFARWIYLAAKNVRSLGAQGLENTPGWAVGWYFVPVFHLWKPYLAMQEIWRASVNPAGWRRRQGGILPKIWWALWLLTGRFGDYLLLTARTPKTIPESARFTSISMAAEACGIVLVIAAIALVLKITSLQCQTAGEGQNSPEEESLSFEAAVAR